MRPGERGITILEVTIALVLTSIVMMGVAGFYLNSQSTWIEASAQAITQRDATLALERIGEYVRGASSAVTPDPSTLVLYDLGGSEIRRFWRSPTDSLLHHGRFVTQDDGPLVPSRVEQFVVSAGGGYVTIQSLVLTGPSNARVEVSTGAALYNRP